MREKIVGIFQNTIKLLLFILSYPFRILAILGMSSFLLLGSVVLLLIIVNIGWIIEWIIEWIFDLINLLK